MNIFTVTTMRLTDEKDVGESRTVAWYPDIETATKCVAENFCNIFELYYTHAVIEELGPGLYPTVCATHWFEWYGDQNGHYQPCARPRQVSGFVSLSIG